MCTVETLWKPAQASNAASTTASTASTNPALNPANPMTAAMGQQLGMQVQMGQASHVMGMGLAQPMMAPQMMMGMQIPGL